MTEIQGKLILVRVSARFELAIGVRVMGSQPYLTPRPFQADPNVSTDCAVSLIKSICFTFLWNGIPIFTICILFKQVREGSSP